MAEHHGIFLIVFVLFFHLGKFAYLNKVDISNEKFFGLPDDCRDANCNYFAPEKYESLKSSSDEDESELLETIFKQHFNEATDASKTRKNKQLGSNDFPRMKIVKSLINAVATRMDESKEAKKRSWNDSTEVIAPNKREWVNRPRVWGKRGKFQIPHPEYFQIQELIDGAQTENDQTEDMWNANVEGDSRMQKRDDPPYRWNYRPKVWGKRAMRGQDFISR